MTCGSYLGLNSCPGGLKRAAVVAVSLLDAILANKLRWLRGGLAESSVSHDATSAAPPRKDVNHVSQRDDVAPHPPLARPSIVHVAESFASGTASAIADFVRNYPDASHRLVYAFRDEAKVDPRELTRFDSVEQLPEGTLARIRFLRGYLRKSHGATIVHAHSSKAGVYVRMAVRRSARHAIFYTP